MSLQKRNKKFSAKWIARKENCAWSSTGAKPWIGRAHLIFTHSQFGAGTHYTEYTHRARRGAPLCDVAIDYAERKNNSAAAARGQG